MRNVKTIYIVLFIFVCTALICDDVLSADKDMERGALASSTEADNAQSDRDAFLEWETRSGNNGEKRNEEEIDDEMEKDIPERREVPYTSEEMAEIIRRRLKIFPEIVFMVENLVAEEGPGGEQEYYYVRDGDELVKMELVDKEDLHKVFIRVNNEATRLHTERLMKQIQAQNALVRNMQQQQMMMQQQATAANLRSTQPSVPAQAMVPQPVVYQPPQQTVHQPPKVHIPPPPPPSPPRNQ